MILVALTIGALALRLWGLDRLLPHDIEPDARIPIQIEILRSGDPAQRSNPYFGKYPLLLAYLGFVLPRADPVELGPEAGLEEHLEGAKAIVLHSRLLIALVSTFLVPLTYFFARNFVARGPALLAAFLVATSPSYLWYSQQARPHAAFAVFALLGVHACIVMARRGDWRASLGAGVCVALAMGTLQSGFTLLLPLLAAAISRVRSEGWRSARTCALSLVPILVLVPMFYPFAFTGSTAERGASQFELDGKIFYWAGHRIDLGLFNGQGFSRLLAIFASWEPWLFLESALGLGWVVRLLVHARARPRRELVVVLAHALPYLLVLGVYRNTMVRFCTPLIPYAAVLGAYGIARTLERLSRWPRAWRVLALAVGSALVLVLPAATVIRQSWLGTQPDTQTMLARWIETERDPATDRILALPRVYLPLYATDEALAKIEAGGSIGWLDWQVQHAERSAPPRRWDLRVLPKWTAEEQTLAVQRPGTALHALEVDIVLLQGTKALRMGRLFDRLLAWTRANCERLAIFRPDRDPDATFDPFFYEDPQDGPAGSHVLRVWGARCLGPVVEVFRAP